MTKDIPPSPSSRDEIILRLFELFRRAGYEGVSIGEISRATGLGKSSLYYHFPGGKADMAAAVVAFAKQWMDAHVFATLRGPGPLKDRVAAMLTAIGALYDGGAAPCLVASMMLSRGTSPSEADVGALIRDWIDAVATALRESGISANEAGERAAAAIITIEGALIVARATERLDIFRDAIERVRKILMA
ncbi:TetR/AcrR family transcriptional regulator [Methylocapsa acidiphila]|uniref:TetR/AcrR family transcriptional regulator n=1 Tax=Methylocapsa acidiphila TaxID=133552 RepID=UPI0003F89A89|nr:TetR/AcrR family transcriptional regulator [Methylocapsa acidiphila]